MIDAMRQIETRLDPLDGEALIANACALALWHQKDLSAHSGISTTTISQIKRGKRCTKAQRAAMYWAVAKRVAR